MLSHDSLKGIILTNFGMMQHHGYSWTELESMIPWERTIYVSLLERYLEEEKKNAAERNGI